MIVMTWPGRTDAGQFSHRTISGLTLGCADGAAVGGGVGGGVGSHGHRSSMASRNSRQLLHGQHSPNLET